jgi:DNA-binding transcriptional MerR regulator
MPENASRQAPHGWLRIDELARLEGTTSRTVRSYQSLGLLPGPRLVGRTGFYGAEHRRRLRAISAL